LDAARPFFCIRLIPSKGLFILKNCSHEFTAIRWRNRKVGLIGTQCTECLATVGTWLKHTDFIDAEKLPDWIDKKSTPRPANDNRLELIGGDGEVSKFVDAAAYSAYLLSTEWRALRGKVILRANGMCEGCLSAPATEVHHLTYKHIYKEFAFELVALCRTCHTNIHSGKGAA
jgi:hypothetical protein